MGSAIRNEGPVDKDIHIKYHIFMHKIFNKDFSVQVSSKLICHTFHLNSQTGCSVFSYI